MTDTVDAREIYRRHADRYDELVRAEDADANLVSALARAVATSGAIVVEVGAGTGRLTRILLDSGAASVIATEREPAMLTLARASLRDEQARVQCVVAEATRLPVPDRCADLGVAGWVFGHFRHWMPERWRDEIGAALDELARTLRPSGSLVVIETLGTGATEPAPPNPGLAEYYAWLEGERGFRRLAIRTDYRFGTVEDAARVTGFFFGDAFADRVRHEGWTTVPECTGVWVRAVEQ